MRVTSHGIQRGLERLRGHIGRGYHTARHFAGQLDHGINFLTRLYSAVQPALKDIAPSVEQATTGRARRALSNYEEMRGTIAGIHGAVRSKVPELGLT